MAEGGEPFSLDRRRLRASFDRASGSYEAAAALQAQVAAELLERLGAFEFEPRVVLDLGAGTGRVTRALKRRYRRALVIALDIAPGMLREARRHQGLLRRFARVCADAERLPLADASVDLVYSSLMLQWCEPLAPALAEVRRVLKPSGFFAFSTLGPDTLRELRAAWAAVDDFSHVHRFLDVHDVGDALAHAGLAEPVLDVDRVTLSYEDTLGLMRDLKAIGAHNVTAGRPRTLSGRARLARMSAAYEPWRQGGRLPATYEVIYGACWGGAGARAAPGQGAEVHIAPAAIRRRGPRVQGRTLEASRK
ncbi:MAG TPA: malonyl-ACP O-methyltransferase BioC [Steroidobacteraceae bacterium]|nr:malonyl-ACP O-methyltransferase BioC [Steroidobacteraceae bacterium]